MGGQKEKVVCSSCGEYSEIEFTAKVNVSTHPELKESILKGELFMWQCEHCGTPNFHKGPFLYHDSENKLLIILTEAKLSGEEIPEGYTARMVRSPGELIEKLKIFDAGLDDVVIETCKYILVQDLKKEVSLKFYKLDGADSEMIFAYPEDGQMQMLQVGFKLYEECSGIVGRNTEIKKATRGLVEVNSEWLSAFFA